MADSTTLEIDTSFHFPVTPNNKYPLNTVLQQCLKSNIEDKDL